MLHDDQGYNHTFEMPLSDIEFAVQVDGSVDLDATLINCRVLGCGSLSVHPVGGGADPIKIQTLFVRLYVQKGLFATPQEALENAKARCENMDGIGRWQVNDAELLSELSAAQ
jgi:hypothetical protein